MNAKFSMIGGQPFIRLGNETLPAPEAVLVLRALQAEATEGLRKAEAGLSEAERAHGIVLADGDEPDRDVLTAAKTDVEKARKTLQSMEADLERIQAEIIASESVRMLDAAIEGIKRDTGTKPDLVESCARRAVELGLRLSVAEVEHGKAQGEVEGVQSRIADIAGRMDAITQKRLSGKEAQGDVGELNALEYDRKTLQKALSRSNKKAAALNPSDLRQHHQCALGDWTKHVQDARLKALALIAMSREAELVDALNRLAGYASVSGIQSMNGLWRPGEELQAFMTRTLISALTRRAA